MSNSREEEKYWEKVFRDLRTRAYSLPGVNNKETAEDIAMEAIRRGIQKAENFDGRNHMGWLYTIMRNANLDRIASAAHRTTDTDSEVGEMELNQEPVEQHAFNEQLVERMREILSSEQFTIVLLKHQGYTHQEIKEIEGITMGTSMSRYSRALEALRDELNELDWE